MAHDDRLDVLDVRAEPLEQRPGRRRHDHRRAPRPGRAAATATRSRRPMVSTAGLTRSNGQRLPGREQLDLVGAEELAPGRRRAGRPPCRSGRRRRAGAGADRPARPATAIGARRLGDGQHGVGPAARRGERRLVAQQRGDGELGSSGRHRAPVDSGRGSRRQRVGHGLRVECVASWRRHAVGDDQLDGVGRLLRPSTSQLGRSAFGSRAARGRRRCSFAGGLPTPMRTRRNVVRA